VDHGGDRRGDGCNHSSESLLGKAYEKIRCLGRTYSNGRHRQDRVPGSGVVEKVFVSEGSGVSQGQSVFLIRAARSSELRGDSQSDVLATVPARKSSLDAEQAAIAQQLQSRLASASQKEHSQEAEIALLSQQRRLQSKRVEIAKEDYGRYVGLVNQDFVGTARKAGAGATARRT
jgi:pyruvate/2-oxoglutarate dehydrogenase complex dihydrolipoamide acyltransferase (E2) component